MTKYLRYVLKNTEPIRITNDSSSRNGQADTLRYIPGSAIRGIVINALAKKLDTGAFETIKKDLFSARVRYFNAYPMAGERELIPALKGFYEDKISQTAKKEIYNFVTAGEFPEGCKRAGLGRFCYPEGDCIHYYTVETGSDLKIKINQESERDKQNVFRNEYIMPNHLFCGYIAMDGNTADMLEEVKSVFDNEVLIGNARSNGLGKCCVISCEETAKVPYAAYRQNEDLKGCCYMLLLSPAAMRNSCGEYCGLDMEALQDKMGVTNLKLERASTSIVQVKGYNRIWGCKTPSVTMYEQGSVFKFIYDGVFSKEAMENISNKGIGVRRNEGFGSVLFMKDYEALKYKQAEEYERVPAVEAGYSKDKFSSEPSKEDKEVLRIAAKGYYRNLLHKKMDAYVVEHPLNKGAIVRSQLGVVESLITAHRYQPKIGKDILDQYFSHASEKEDNNKVQKKRNSIKPFENTVRKILNEDLETILRMEKKDSVMRVPVDEILSEDERWKLKFELLLKWIRYDSKTEE